MIQSDTFLLQSFNYLSFVQNHLHTVFGNLIDLEMASDVCRAIFYVCWLDFWLEICCLFRNSIVCNQKWHESEIKVAGPNNGHVNGCCWILLIVSLRLLAWSGRCVRSLRCLGPLRRHGTLEEREKLRIKNVSTDLLYLHSVHFLLILILPKLRNIILSLLWRGSHFKIRIGGPGLQLEELRPFR